MEHFEKCWGIKVLLSGKDQFFLDGQGVGGGGLLGNFQNISSTEKAAEKKSCKGSHEEKN